MIQLQQIGRFYRQKQTCIQALQEVDLQVEAGEYVALTGPSGSGKSTLLHLLGCLDRPDQGRYFLNGQDVRELTVPELAKLRNRRFGFIFQGFHLLPRLTAMENVIMPMRFAGIGGRPAEDRAQALLQRMKLQDRLHHRPHELSGGQQQRVAIARALANRPEILFADEPTGNLDSAHGHEILLLLDEIHRQGTTIFLVSHDPNLAARARRQVRLLDGRVESDEKGPVADPHESLRPDHGTGIQDVAGES
ncbi:MAG: ABC transporter ATP-binding protein [Planctomycetota bacterium]|nr:MAG: ABC transporter ATP-binding protein [Planctomycetota bacterium]